MLGRPKEKPLESSLGKYKTSCSYNILEHVSSAFLLPELNGSLFRRLMSACQAL